MRRWQRPDGSTNHGSVLVYGPPRNQTELSGRVIAALAEKAAATAENANDRPVLVDLGQTPADPIGTAPTPAEPAEPAPSPVPPRTRPGLRGHQHRSGSAHPSGSRPAPG